MKSRITGQAKSKILVRTATDSWSKVKDILKENYQIRRTVDYYACQLFNARQRGEEGVASWASRIDSLQSQLRESVARVMSPDLLPGAMKSIEILAKASY